MHVWHALVVVVHVKQAFTDRHSLHLGRRCCTTFNNFSFVYSEISSPPAPSTFSAFTTAAPLTRPPFLAADVIPFHTYMHDDEQVMASKMTLGGDVDFQQIAKKTPGFVGADLSSLTKEAAVVAINRIFTRLRAVSPPPSGNSAVLSASKPHEALENGGGNGATGGGAVAVAPAPGATASVSSPTAATTNESSTSVGEGGVTSGGAGAQKGAEAVGGFLAGPLSAAQLAPLSVTMEDFLMAVKKVRCAMFGDTRFSRRG